MRWVQVPSCSLGFEYRFQESPLETASLVSGRPVGPSNSIPLRPFVKVGQFLRLAKHSRISRDWRCFTKVEVSSVIIPSNILESSMAKALFMQKIIYNDYFFLLSSSSSGTRLVSSFGGPRAQGPESWQVLSRSRWPGAWLPLAAVAVALPPTHWRVGPLWTRPRMTCLPRSGRLQQRWPYLAWPDGQPHGPGPEGNKDKILDRRFRRRYCNYISITPTHNLHRLLEPPAGT